MKIEKVSDFKEANDFEFNSFFILAKVQSAHYHFLFDFLTFLLNGFLHVQISLLQEGPLMYIRFSGDASDSEVRVEYSGDPNNFAGFGFH